MSKRLSILLMLASWLLPIQVWGQNPNLPPTSPVYTLVAISPSDFGVDELVQVDGYTGAVVPADHTECEGVDVNCPATAIAFGPDGNLYVMKPPAMIRVYGAGGGGGYSSVTHVGSFETTPTCSTCAAPPLAGMAFNPADDGLYFAAADGIWKLPFVQGSGISGQPTHLNNAYVSTYGLGEGMTFTPFDLNHQLIPNGQTDLLVADHDHNTLLVSSPPYSSIAPLSDILDPGVAAIIDFYLDQPVGIAADSLGEVFVANHGTSQPGVICINFNGQVIHLNPTYASFPAGDYPLYVTPNPYLGAVTGSLFVSTVQDDRGNGGKLWRLDPTNTPGEAPCGPNAAVTFLADLGMVGGGLTTAAFPSVPVPLVTGTGIVSFAGPLAGLQFQIRSGTAIPNNTAVTTTAIAYSQTDFANMRLAGSTFLAQNPNASCVAYPPSPILPPSPCYVFHNQFVSLDTNTAITLPSTPGATVFATVNNLYPPNPINPGLLGAASGTNSWSNDFLTAYITPATATTPDPLTIVGVTSDLNQDFVAVSLGASVPGTFQGFQTPLAPKNARTFPSGETIAVKFQDINAAGRFVTNATARLSVVFLGAPPVVQAASPANLKGISPNTFTYNAKSNTYQFYLNTTGYGPGLYSLSVFSNSFATQEVTFTIH